MFLIDSIQIIIINLFGQLVSGPLFHLLLASKYWYQLSLFNFIKDLLIEPVFSFNSNMGFNFIILRKPVTRVKSQSQGPKPNTRGQRQLKNMSMPILKERCTLELKDA
jgi:hypothetical protein